MYYAGIGSRSTPKSVLEAFEYIGEELAKKGYKLRSGGADGADRAFEKGCVKANGEMEIFLPWEGFNQNKSPLFKYENAAEAFELAKKYHPNWDACSKGGKALMARNGYQVLGKDLNTPVGFIICFTEGGKGQGGTGQALRIAKDKGIPVCDFGKYKEQDAMKQAKILVAGIEKKFPIEEPEIELE